MKNLLFLLILFPGCFLGACAASEKLSSVVPGQSVGAIRLGMTASQVKGMLGEPRVGAELHDAVSYTYPSAGINVLMSTPQMLVKRIDAGSGYTQGQWTREFWGSTHEGVEIGSTRDQVRKAYGAPDPLPATRRGGPIPDDLMIYRARGITFQLVGGRVVRMSVYPANSK